MPPTPQEQIAQELKTSGELLTQLLVCGLAVVFLKQKLSSPKDLKPFNFRSFPLVDTVVALGSAPTTWFREVKTLLRVGPKNYLRRTLFSIKQQVR